MQTVTEAAHSRAAGAAGDGVELLLFRLGGDIRGQHSELFGIHVFHVREIVAMPAVTAIAGAPPQVLGVVNLRGEIIRVFDLPCMTACVPATGLNIMLVTEYDGATQAFAVESVEEIVLLGLDSLLPGGHGAVKGFARLDDMDSGSRLAQILDLEAILAGATG